MENPSTIRRRVAESTRAKQHGIRDLPPPLEQPPTSDEEDYQDAEGEAEKENDKERVVKKYFQQIKASEGFDIEDYPGYIQGVTVLVPLTHVFDNREARRGDYNNLVDMATMAIGLYNKQNRTKFKLVEVIKANVKACRVRENYITFTGVECKHSLASSVSYCLVGNVTAVLACIMTIIAVLVSIAAPFSSARDKILDKQLKMHSCQYSKASLDELQDVNARRKTFQAVVLQNLVGLRYRRVYFCREAS